MTSSWKTKRQRIQPKALLRQPNRLKATIITPALRLGGAERWCCDLVIGSSHLIDWSVVILYMGDVNAAFLGSILRYADIYTPDPYKSDFPLFTYETPEECVKEATKNATAILSWGGGYKHKTPKGIPHVFVAHGSSSWTRKEALRVKANGNCSHIVNVSSKTEKCMAGIELPQRTIWSACDDRRVLINRTPREIRNQWGVKYPHFMERFHRYIGYLGRIGDEKNVEGMIRAVTLLPDYYKAVVIGDGPATQRIDAVLQAILPCRHYRVPPVDDVGNHLNAFSCLVQLSPSEGNSILVNEAMRIGTPIVTTREGAIDDYEEAAKHPLFWCTPDDPLATEVASLIRDAVKQGKKSDRAVAAKIFANDNLTQERLANDWYVFLSSL